MSSDILSATDTIYTALRKHRLASDDFGRYAILLRETFQS
jgi:hypothetical protein